MPTGIYIRGSTEQRFWSNIDKEGPVVNDHPEVGRCWLWKGSKNNAGYPVFHFDGKTRLTHRYAWELLVGPIPPQIELDHGPFCHRHECVNPYHHRLATHRQNGRNLKLSASNKTGLKGVHKYKGKEQWKATIMVNYKTHNLGRFNSPEEAYQAYCEAASRLHGEFANLGKNHKGER